MLRRFIRRGRVPRIHRSHERNSACYKQSNHFPSDIGINPFLKSRMRNWNCTRPPFASSGAFKFQQQDCIFFENVGVELLKISTISLFTFLTETMSQKLNCSSVSKKLPFGVNLTPILPAFCLTPQNLMEAANTTNDCKASSVCTCEGIVEERSSVNDSVLLIP